MNHTLRLSLTAHFPAIAKAVFFNRYRTAISTGKLPGGWKESELLLLPTILDYDSVFFDIGANVGIYSFIASRYIKHENLHSFEPMPKYYKALKELFPNSNIHNIALSNKAGSSVLKIPEIDGKSYSARATLNVDFKEDNESVEDSTRIEVSTLTLDEYCEQSSVSRIDLIKIDVEGHESKVLQGAMKSIERYKPTLIVEIEQRHSSDDIAHTVNSVKALNYICYYHDGTEGKLIQIDEDFDRYQDISLFGTSKYVNNFIFLPQ